MTIRKGSFTFTFLFDDNINSLEEVSGMTMSEIIAECDDGDMLGQSDFSQTTFEEVPNDRVPAEEMALGCDGTFFADRDELEHARLDAESERPDRDCDATCTRRMHPAAECDCSRSE